MLNTELKNQIKKLWTKFWESGISNPLTAIEQISYLIFMKRLEDMDNQHKKSAELRSEKYTSIFKGNEKCKWSYWINANAEEMLEHVRDKVFPFIKNLRDENSLFGKAMKDAVFIIPRPSLLQEAVKQIDELNINQQNQDTQGDIYEYLLSELQTSGKNGQFRTPRHIIRMMVKLTDPKFGQKICDPACGTGGFLINAYQHILEENTSKDLIEYDEDDVPYHLVGDKLGKKKLEVLKESTFYGFDFDTTMMRIAVMNAMLHGVDKPNIFYTDTLSKAYEEKEKYDCILANPPFKGNIDKSDISGRLKIKTTKTELLFVSLFLELLVIGGRCAVIVPDGVLFGSSNAHKDLRKILVDENQLDGVISMPSGVFKPYAGVSTAVLVFTKGGVTDKVWFYDMEKDGFSLDDKRQKLQKEENDIPDIIEKWKNREIKKEPKKGEKWFWVNKKEIIENNYDLSISRYKPIEYEEVKYEKPEVIMERVLRLEKEIEKDLDEIGSTINCKKLITKN